MTVRYFKKLLCEFHSGIQGSVALLAAVFLPFVVLGGLMAVEHASRTKQAFSLQDATDAAALAAAREMMILSGVPGVNLTGELKRVAQGMIDATLDDERVTTETSISLPDSTTVRVDAALVAPSLLGMFWENAAQPLQAHAIAQMFAAQDVCAATLDPDRDFIMDLNNKAEIIGPGCAIYSNSKHKKGMILSEESKIEAGHICSAGGARGSSSAYKPRASEDCPPLKDPMVHKVDPVAGYESIPCTTDDAQSYDGYDTATLSPGKHCGDLTIAGHAKMEFEPGVHVFDDAILTLDGDSTIAGEDVVLVFTGDRSRMVIAGNAEVDLSGRVSGDFAGMLLLAEPRGDGEMREFTITSGKVRRLVGTIYLPGDYLNIMTDQEVASDSAFTVVMSRRMKLHGGAKLVLNRDYASTTVPKDGGLSGYGGGIRLVE